MLEDEGEGDEEHLREERGKTTCSGAGEAPGERTVAAAWGLGQRAKTETFAQPMGMGDGHGRRKSVSKSRLAKMVALTMTPLSVMSGGRMNERCGRRGDEPAQTEASAVAAVMHVAPQEASARWLESGGTRAVSRQEGPPPTGGTHDRGDDVADVGGQRAQGRGQAPDVNEAPAVAAQSGLLR